MEALANLWVHGGLAVAAGLVILLFPKVFFFLIGSFLVINGGLTYYHGGDLFFSIALALAGVLVFLSPQLVAWFIAFYLVVFGGLLFIWGFWFLAIPVGLFALFVALVPKIAPFLTGLLLIGAGGVSLLTRFL
jgi:hypothetical protein